MNLNDKMYISLCINCSSTVKRAKYYNLTTTQKLFNRYKFSKTYKYNHNEHIRIRTCEDNVQRISSPSP